MKCVYCADEIRKGTGIMYVHRDGNIAYYCSNKCWNFHTQMKRRFNRKVQKQKSGSVLQQKEKG
jgi:ribosomal protein L24E